MIRPPPSPPLFPYTTLFRSEIVDRDPDPELAQGVQAGDRGLAVEVARLGDLELESSRREPVPGKDRRDARHEPGQREIPRREDRKSTRLNSSHMSISYAVFC